MCSDRPRTIRRCTAASTSAAWRARTWRSAHQTASRSSAHGATLPAREARPRRSITSTIRQQVPKVKRGQEAPPGAPVKHDHHPAQAKAAGLMHVTPKAVDRRRNRPHLSLFRIPRQFRNYPKKRLGPSCSMIYFHDMSLSLGVLPHGHSPLGYGHAEFPAGIEGTRWTVTKLLAAIRGEPPFPRPSPAIRELAESILASYRWPRTAYGRIIAVYQWYLDHLVVPQVRDRRRIEEIRGPDYMLQRIRILGRSPADCDDTITLLGALLESIDIPIRVVVIGTYVSGTPDEYSHIYLKADTGDGLIALDPIHGREAGWETMDRSIQEEVEV